MKTVFEEWWAEREKKTGPLDRSYKDLAHEAWGAGRMAEIQKRAFEHLEKMKHEGV